MLILRPCTLLNLNCLYILCIFTLLVNIITFCLSILENSTCDVFKKNHLNMLEYNEWSSENNQRKKIPQEMQSLLKRSLAVFELCLLVLFYYVTGTSKPEHITPISVSLHWLPVTYRIDFKILLVVFKSLNGVGPQYICDLPQVHVSSRSLRSVNQLQLVIPKINTTLEFLWSV